MLQLKGTVSQQAISALFLHSHCFEDQYTFRVFLASRESNVLLVPGTVQYRDLWGMRMLCCKWVY